MSLFFDIGEIVWAIFFIVLVILCVVVNLQSKERMDNKYCTLTYNRRKKVITVNDKIVIQNFRLNFRVSEFYQDSSPDEVWEVLKSVFTEHTTYAALRFSMINVGLVEVFYSDANIVDIAYSKKIIANQKEKPQKTNKVKASGKKIVEQPKTNTDKVTKIDVNNADVTQLSSLPGITIIVAKKIIKIREWYGEFFSVDDFFTRMEIKPHFQKILINKIEVKSMVVEQNNEPQTESERTVDF